MSKKVYDYDLPFAENIAIACGHISSIVRPIDEALSSLEIAAMLSKSPAHVKRIEEIQKELSAIRERFEFFGHVQYELINMYDDQGNEVIEEGGNDESDD